MVQGTEIVATLRRFLLATLQRRRRRTEISPTESLINGGVIDSLSVVELIAFIERHYALEFDLEDLVAENFDTLQRIAALVASKQRRGARPLGS